MNKGQTTIQKNPSTSHKLILIADADAQYGRALAQAIREETSYYAMNVQDGFEMLKFFEGVKPNLILLDYQFSEREWMRISHQFHRTSLLKEIPIFRMYGHTYFSLHHDEKSLQERAEKLYKLETIFDTLQEMLA
jgi:PleD family two-component response regulator